MSQSVDDMSQQKIVTNRPSSKKNCDKSSIYFGTYRSHFVTCRLGQMWFVTNSPTPCDTCTHVNHVLPTNIRHHATTCLYLSKNKKLWHQIFGDEVGKSKCFVFHKGGGALATGWSWVQILLQQLCCGTLVKCSIYPSFGGDTKICRSLLTGVCQTGGGGNV